MSKRRGPTDSEMRVAVMQLATDEELCSMFAITPETLTKHRELIDKARARAVTGMRFQRVKAQARAVKRARPAAGGASGSGLTSDY